MSKVWRVRYTVEGDPNPRNSYPGEGPIELIANICSLFIEQDYHKTHVLTGITFTREDDDE